MYVEKGKAEDLHDAAQVACGLFCSEAYVDSDLMNEYKNLLEDIAKKRKYAEGERILNSDLVEINIKVKGILDNMGRRLSKETKELADSARDKYDFFGSMLAVTDRMFAEAQRTLGSPDMPPSFGPDVQEALQNAAVRAVHVAKLEDHEKVDVTEYYNNQRKKSADEVRSDNDSILKALKDKKATSLDVARLTAEYQALAKRQEGHIFLWKWFHGEEDAARNQLLKDMRAALRAAVGSNVDLKETTPLSMANKFNKTSISRAALTAFEDDGIAKRYNVNPFAYRYEAKNSDRAIEEYNKKHEKVNTTVDEKANVETKENVNAVDNEPIRIHVNIEKNEIDNGKRTEVAPPVIDALKKDEIGKNI